MAIRGDKVGRWSSFALSSAMALAAGAGLCTGARGALLLTYNGGTPITDGGPGDLDNSVNGQIFNQTFVAGFGITINVATSNSPGDPTGGLLQISSLNIKNNNPGTATLSINVSDTNFTTPGGAATPMTLSSSVGGTFTNAVIGDSVSFQSFADPSNAQPSTAVSTPVQTYAKSLVVNPESFSSNATTAWVRGGGPYSLTNITQLTLSPNAQLNVSGTTIATPEPTSLAVLGLSAVTLAARRRRNR